MAGGGKRESGTEFEGQQEVKVCLRSLYCTFLLYSTSLFCITDGTLKSCFHSVLLLKIGITMDMLYSTKA